MNSKTIDKRHLEKHSEIDMKITKVEKDIEYMRQAFADALKEHKLILDKIDKFIDASQDKFASKDIEQEVSKLKEWQTQLNLKLAGVAGGAIVVFYLFQILLTKLGLI